MNSRIARLAWISAVGLLSLNPAQAEEPDQPPRATGSAAPATQPLAGLRLTLGDDRKAGQWLQFHGGLEFRRVPAAG
jgi:hypothetical protein